MFTPRSPLGVTLLCCGLLVGCEAGDLELPPPPDSSVVITGFSPTQGYAGDLIRVNGTGFGASLNGVEVLFAGGAARPEAIAADGTSLTVRLPVGISDGTLIVVAPGGRGTSKESLTYLGAGHLRRPGTYSTSWVSSGLGNVTAIDGQLWIHASEMNQFVQPWPEEKRVRALIPEQVMNLSPKSDAQGRLVFITKTSLYAAKPADLGDEKTPDLIATGFGPVPLSRVFVMANGTSAVIVQGVTLISVDLSQQDHKKKSVTMEEGFIVGMLESDTGSLILVRKKTDGTTVIESREPVTLDLVKKATSPTTLSGAMVTWQGPSNDWLGFADTDGQLRYINLDTTALDNKPTNLFVDEGATDLLLSPDKTTLYSALPRHGRVTASSAATRTVLWSVQIDGEPTRLGINSDGKLVAVDPKQNRVTLIDPATQKTLGERQIGLGLGSPLNPRWGARMVGDSAYALARESLAIGVLETSTFNRRLGAILLRTPLAFAVAPDASTAVIIHADSTIGVTALHRDAFQIEKIICNGGPLNCDPISSPLVAIEYLATDRVLIVTNDTARIVKLPSLATESQKTAPVGARFVGALPGTEAIGLVTATGNPTEQLTFEEYDFTTGFKNAPVRSIEETTRIMNDALTFLGLGAFRRSDAAGLGTEQTGLAFFFAHLVDPRGRTAIDVLDREDPRLVAPTFTGAHPTFSPDGRQFLGLGAGVTAGHVMISEGDLLSTTGIEMRASIDFGTTLTGVAYEPGGERAFVVNGDKDQIFVLE